MELFLSDILHRRMSHRNNISALHQAKCNNKGPVKLIQRVKIANSFLHFVSNLFHFIILRLPM